VGKVLRSEYQLLLPLITGMKLTRSLRILSPRAVKMVAVFSPGFSVSELEFLQFFMFLLRATKKTSFVQTTLQDFV
jgi:hypothetical protein